MAIHHDPVKRELLDTNRPPVPASASQVSRLKSVQSSDSPRENLFEGVKVKQYPVVGEVVGEVVDESTFRASRRDRATCTLFLAIRVRRPGRRRSYVA